jgi:hypothetical protein
VVFFRLHPLAESDPAERTEAREETAVLEAVDFLADPDSALKPPRTNFAEWLAEQPEWKAPPDSARASDDEEDEEENGPRFDLFARAYAQYIRETWPERAGEEAQ